MEQATKTDALIGRVMTRAVTAEQINENRGAPLVRAAEIPSEAIDEEARTVELAFSSDAPVMRWFGEEVLDHSPGAMDMTRLDSGAALLVDHDTRDQVGVIERAWLGDDRVGRAVARFSRSARGEEIWQDIRDGIRRHISVGYSASEIDVEKRDGQPDLVTLRRWQPFEVSIVSVPADVGVGIGRAAGEGEPPEEAAAGGSDTGGDENQTTTCDEVTGMERILRNAAGDLVRARVDDQGNIVEQLEVLERAADVQARVEEAGQAERTRTADILEIGEQYSVQQLAAQAVRSGESVSDFTRRVLDHVGNRGAERETQALSDDAGEIGMTDREVNRFSFIRAARAILHPESRVAQEDAAFEFEASAAAQRSMGREVDGITVPVDVLSRAFNTSTSGSSPGDTGGYLIDTTLASQSFIEMLRNRAVLLSLGTPMGGLVGNLDIPGQTASGNVFIVGEDEDVGEGSVDTGLVSLSPTTIGVFGRVTRRMIQQSSLDVELMFRDSLATDLALGIDYYGFYGDGVGNNPLGILKTSGINAVTFDALHPDYEELVEMETEVNIDNALTDGVRYIANAKFRGHCKTTQKFAGTNGMPIWEAGGTVDGTACEITNQFADGDVLFGNLKDALIGLWGGLDILNDPYTQSLSGTRRVVLHQDFDIALRRKESFCYGKMA